MTPLTREERAGILAALARLDAAGAEVRRALEAAGIPCVLIKGRGFARRLYDEVWERPYSDTDIVIAPAALEQAQSVLAQLGYRRIDRDGDRLGAAGYAHTFAGPGGALIDLHWNLSGVSAPAARTWELVSPHTVELDVGGHPARVPDDALTALITVLHSAHHGARWPTATPDLERAAERLGPAAWDEAGALARELGAEEAFAAGLALSPAGRELAARLGIEASISFEYSLRAEATPYTTWALHRLRGAPDWRARLGVVGHILAPPPATMRRYFGLARRGRRGLAAAYLLRPLRLIARALPALTRYRRARRRS